MLLILPLAVSCSNPAYDISEGLNKDITLFEKEISVPLGSLAPISIGATLNGVSRLEGLGGLISEYIKVGEDDNLLMESDASIFKINVYELENKMADPNVAELWHTGYETGYPGGIIPLLSIFGLKTTNQKMVITADNPLVVNVAATGTASYNCVSSDNYYTANIPELSSFTFGQWTTGQELVSVTVPENVTEALTSIGFEDLTLDLPAKPTSLIGDKTGDLYFAINCKYSCNVAVGEDFSLPVSDLPVSLNLPVAKYKIKKFKVDLAVDNTVPLALTVNDIKVLKPKEDENDPDEVDDNVRITTGFTLAGGTLEQPATTAFTLTVEALTGTLPDIDRLSLSFELASQPGLGVVTISALQGIHVNSASAKLSDGITIPLN